MEEIEPKEELVELFYKIKKIVQQKIYYVPREYKTIGGQWTVDTWKKKDVTVQLMDEGWTTVIFSENFEIINGGSSFVFEKGSMNELEEALQKLLSE